MIYLSGPMTGMKGLNRRAFANARRSLRARFPDEEIISPPHLDEEDAHCGTWEECLRRDLYYVLESRLIVVLPGWEKSEGATLEVHVARRLGTPIVRYPDLRPC
jgi:hypothetical protein